MKKKALVLVATALFLVSCRKQPNLPASSTNNSNTQATQAETQNTQAKQSDYHWETETLAENLRVPWDVAVLPSSNELLFTQRAGKVQKLDLRTQVVTDIATISQSREIGEGGLTGITLHPDFEASQLIYLYYTYSQNGQAFNRISQFKYSNDSLSEEKFIVDNLPGGTNHNSGRLRFGPDGKLYILTGDAGRSSTAQDPKSLGGKILRVNADSSIPNYNPDPESPVFTLGHRNPQGLDWHPLTKQLIATEHGQEAHDEINLIETGKNYGWPQNQQCFGGNDRYTNPIFCSETRRFAPSGAAFLGSRIKAFANSFFFATLRGEALRKVDIINGKAENETVILDKIGRIRGVTSLDNKSLIITTSNRDGRGTVRAGDDKIIKVTPVLNTDTK